MIGTKRMSINLWMTSDTHVSHKTLLEKYEPERRKKWSNITEMNEGIIDAHNALVGDNDIVWFLGDCLFGKEHDGIPLFRRMKGIKHLILGNHDHIKDRGLWLTAFKSIQHYKELSVDNNKICLFHFGQRVWNKSHHGSIHLHGHSHGSLPPHGKSVDVGLDAPWITGKKEHRPFNYDEIKKFMDGREIALVDHHGAHTND